MVVLNHYGCNILSAASAPVAHFRVPASREVWIHRRRKHGSDRFGSLIQHILVLFIKGKMLYATSVYVLLPNFAPLGFVYRWSSWGCLFACQIMNEHSCSYLSVYCLSSLTLICWLQAKLWMHIAVVYLSVYCLSSLIHHMLITS